MTAEAFRELMASQGREIPIMPLEEVAGWAVDGLLSERFWILPDGDMDHEVRARADAIIDRTHPYVHVAGI